MRPFVEKQTQEQGQQVDQGRGYLNARVVLLVVGRALYFLLPSCLASFLLLPADRLCRQRLLIIERPGKRLLVILRPI
jgi:hypothetical protein